MSRSTPEYPRLLSEARATTATAARPVSGDLETLCGAFETATGWALRYQNASQARADESNGGMSLWAAGLGSGTADGRLTIAESASGAAIEQHAAFALADALADTVNDRLRTQAALWRREAELAAGVPVAPRGEHRARLAELLEKLLSSVADLLSCQAAAMYSLDEATTELKLRSSWGLPRGRLVDPPRQLADAPADLEALSGHAVVLDDATAVSIWKAPEPCQAAICLPISSFDNVIGTLWVLSEGEREFDDAEVNVAEIVAGRLATELERAMLAVEAERSADARRELDALAQMQREQMPSVSPHCQGWDVAGWTPHAPRAAGGFFDWFPLEGERLAVVLAECTGRGACAALMAGALRAALRAHGEHTDDPGRLLEAANRTVWSVSTGDQTAAALCLVLTPGEGQAHYAWAGKAAGRWLGPRQSRDLTDAALPLGIDPLTLYETRTVDVAPGELLALASGPGTAIGDETTSPTATAAEPFIDLAAWSRAHPAATARTLADLLRPRRGAAAHERSILVVRRT